MRTTSAMRRLAVLAPATGAALLLGIAAAPTALAHAQLVSSSPEADEELNSAPEEISLTFSEEVQGGGGTVSEEQDDGSVVEMAEDESSTAIVVTGPDDQTYEEGDVQIDGEEVSTDVQPLESPGDYTVAYRIVSADGHPVEEELTFTLTEEGADAAASEGGESAGGESADGEDAGGGANNGQEDGSAAGSENADSLMSTYGPVGVAVGAIAVVAVLVIMVVRMRNRPGQGTNEG